MTLTTPGDGVEPEAGRLVANGGPEAGRAIAHGVDRVVDARGLRCPAPVIRLAAAARDGAGVITVWWTDPAAEHDIPAWARMRGHAVLGTEPLRAPPESASPTRDHATLAHSTRPSGVPVTPGPAYATRVRIAGAHITPP